ncbi:MAG: ATP phosphoribosyltransferase regulatory subunit [Azospirillaceae bacterium]
MTDETLFEPSYPPLGAAADTALLPAGLHDVLPPEAAHEAAVTDRLMAMIAAHGYARVKPPLIEFEDSLLSGTGAGLSKDTFRLMDPISQRMMGVRADITVQIARIARDRLGNAARPLRLSYAGQTLRVKGDQLRPERQVAQVGAELIGVDVANADAEIVALASEALGAVGVERLTVDLTVPTLVAALLREAGVENGAAERLRQALDRKDAAAIDAVGAEAGARHRAVTDTLKALLLAGGPAARALDLASRLDLGPSASLESARLAQVVGRIAALAPAAKLTIDWVEHRGYEYHTGIAFTVFARGVRGELGRGGRYLAGAEPSTGFTLYLDSILRALPPAPHPALAYVPLGEEAAAARLRADGWAVVSGLMPVADPARSARRLGCSHVWRDGKVIALQDIPG